MSQLSLAGMPRPLYAATPARLGTYRSCPRRYRLGYLDRPAPARGAGWARTSVGASVHLALARWWDLPRGRRTPRSGGDLVVSGWLVDGFRDAAQSRAARDRARAQVEHYLADVDPGERPLGVERTVTVTTARASLWGRVDRIDDRGEEGAVVVDYKTGATPPEPERARDSTALAVYAAGAAVLFRRPCTRVELHHLPSGRVAAWEHTAESLAGHLRRADEVAAELAVLDQRAAAGLNRAAADEAFPARVGPGCGWCPVRSACRPGQAVPAQPAWAGVPQA